MDSRGFIKSFLSSNISKIISLVIFSLLTITFKVFNPICIKYIVDFSLKGSFDENGKIVILFTVLLGFSTGLSLICDMIRQSKTTSFGNDITLELRSSTYQAIMKSELYELNKYNNDELSETVISATRVIGNDYISDKLIKLLYNAIHLVSVLILLLVFDSTMAFLTILTLPIYYVANKYLRLLLNKIKASNDVYNTKHHEIITDNLTDLKTIKTRNGVETEIDSYDRTLSQNKNIFAKKVITNNILTKFLPIMFISVLTFVLFLRFCYELYNNQNMEWLVDNIGVLIACTILVPKAITLCKNVLDLYSISIDIDAEYEKISNVLNLRAERRAENVPSLEEIHSLKFNNVSFDYTIYGVHNMVNLEKIEFEIKIGERLGIIGLPGSGKTTIADLITKLIRPKQGNVLINNCDINKLNTNYLRNIVTYVPESYNLLNTSIEKNVTYPLSLDEYKYNDALNKCKLKDLIFSLPQRDETNAREANLSESEVQKIAIANAFYKESPIMVLDDATSKLDSVTEEAIMNEFFKLKNKISIVISSRINNIVKCDKILILSNGKVIEYGKVDELLSKRTSMFAKMVSEANLDKKVV